MRKYYSIQAAARQIGVSRGTIYAWERRGVIRPLKNHLGWRYFTVEMIQRLRGLVTPK